MYTNKTCPTLINQIFHIIMHSLYNDAIICMPVHIYELSMLLKYCMYVQYCRLTDLQASLPNNSPRCGIVSSRYVHTAEGVNICNVTHMHACVHLQYIHVHTYAQCMYMYVQHIQHNMPIHTLLTINTQYSYTQLCFINKHVVYIVFSM